MRLETGFRGLNIASWVGVFGICMRSCGFSDFWGRSPSNTVTLVVLGFFGLNVGAGMTEEIGYFLDEDGGFAVRVNYEIVQVQSVVSRAGEEQLRELIELHWERTGSGKARMVLDN